MKLSVICPSIRTDNLPSMYDSVCESTSRPFELIVVSPYPLPEQLKNKSNVKLIKDFGNPVRCSNLGLMFCEGELLTWNADDGTFLPGMIDKAIDAYEEMPANVKNVLITKYMEGTPVLQPESYFKLTNAYPKTPYIDTNWWIFNLVITRTEYFQNLGGWDCAYETLAVAHADMAVRAQRDGCITKVFHDPIVFNTHGHSDHRPIEDAHNQNDIPLYTRVYSDPNCVHRRNIGPDNWKNSPRFWRRRFGEMN